MQYRQEKKRTNLPKSYELALLYGKAKWRLFNTASTPCDSFAPIFTLTSCPQQIAVPFAVCSFGGFGDIAFTSRTSKLDDSLQHRNILYNVKQFNVQLKRLIFCKAIRRKATPFDITLNHFTQRCNFCLYAVPFYITLSHFTQRYTVCAYAVLFDITLSHFTQRYTVCVRAVLFDIALSHFTQR